MGFMDKAKQMAEQAQQKIDEAQKQFNESQSQRGGEQGGGVRYDKHGRPITEEPAAAQAPPAPVGGTPATEQPAAAPEQPAAASPAEQQPAAAAEPAVEEQPVPPPAPPKEGVNTAPDPFKPIE